MINHKPTGYTSSAILHHSRPGSTTRVPRVPRVREPPGHTAPEASQELGAGQQLGGVAMAAPLGGAVLVRRVFFF